MSLEQRKPRKRIRFGAKLKHMTTWTVNFDFVDGEVTQTKPAEPVDDPRYWIELEMSPSDARVVERVLRRNGGTRIEVTDV